MVSHISYYFGLFKKFQVLNHVPSNSVHGAAAPAGGFNLKNPHAPFENSNAGTPLTSGDFTPANNPLWAVLNSRAQGNAGFTPVTIATARFTKTTATLSPIKEANSAAQTTRANSPQAQSQ